MEDGNTLINQLKDENGLKAQIREGSSCMSI